MFLIDSLLMNMRLDRKTLSNIPGSTTSGQLSKQTQEWGHGLLVPIASEIDKDLRLTLIPAKIDAKLLDFDIPVAYVKYIFLCKSLDLGLSNIANFIEEAKPTSRR